MNHFLFLFLIEYEQANKKIKFKFFLSKKMMMRRSYRLKIIVNCFSQSISCTLHLKMRKIIIRYTSRKRENLHLIIIFQISITSNRNRSSSIPIYIYIFFLSFYTTNFIVEKKKDIREEDDYSKKK